jgi:hypothetical protein
MLGIVGAGMLAAASMVASIGSCNDNPTTQAAAAAELNAAALPPDQEDLVLAIDATDGEALCVLRIDVGGQVQSATWMRHDGVWREWAAAQDNANNQQTTAPPGLTGASLVHHARLGGFVLFGGRKPDGSLSDETWLFSHDSWHRVDGPSPPARCAAGCAYDSQRGVAVLFGGRSDSAVHAARLGDTWELSETGWRRSNAGIPSEGTDPRRSGGAPLDFSAWPDTPSPRYGPALAYDARAQRIMLYSGYSHHGHVRDLWRYHDGRWSLVLDVSRQPPPGTPTGDFGSGLAFDPIAGELIVFGGCDGGAEVMAFRDGNWHERTKATDAPVEAGQPAPAAGPRNRTFHAFVYDPLAKGILLAGGLSASRDGWWVWRDGAWSPTRDIK